MDPSQRRLAEIGLRAAEQYGFALAGGNAEYEYLERYPDRRFSAYGAGTDQIAGLRARFRAWRAELVGEEEPPASN